MKIWDIKFLKVPKDFSIFHHQVASNMCHLEGDIKKGPLKSFENYFNVPI